MGVDPYADNACNEFKEVDVGSSSEFGGEFEAPGSAAVGETSYAMFAGVGSVGYGWLPV